MQQFNAVVLGAGGVGKSALTARFTRDVFLEHYNPTIEEEYRHIIDVDGVLSALDILDSAGAEQFLSMNETYIKSGRGFVLVFSLTQEASLREVETLRQEIYRVKGGDSSVPIVIVGTKLDLLYEREVPRSVVQDLAQRWNVPVYETSAKRNWHVAEVFEDLVRQMRVRYPAPLARKPGRPARKSCTVCDGLR